MAKQNSIQKQIKDIVRSIDASATVILYGSRARGTAKKGSDWDVLILSKDNVVSTQAEQLFIHKLYDLELKTGEPISPLVYSMHDWNTKLSITPLYQNIREEGITL